MAYSDYGGYAYREGIRIPERSDVTISEGGDRFCSPGNWSGDDFPSGHVVLGSGPIFVTLYKQSYLDFHRGFKQLNLLDFAIDVPEDAICSYGNEKFIYTDYYKNSKEKLTIEIDGNLIEAYFLIEDNHYQYVRLTQPDGIVWTGFSGYGVGAGLENCGYGYSTEDRETKLKELFP